MDAVRMEKRIRHLEPERRVTPGSTELVVILEHVLVSSIRRQLIATARSADCNLEAAIRCNGVVRQDAAIAPAATSQAFLICDTGRDQMINAGKQVLDLLVAPVPEYRFRKFNAAPAAAAVVHARHDKTLGRIHLRFEFIAVQSHGMLVLPVRT